jgi:transcriptional antiterminator NusG
MTMTENNVPSEQEDLTSVQTDTAPADTSEVDETQATESVPDVVTSEASADDDATATATESVTDELDGDDDEDDDDDESGSLLFLSGDWYVVHTYAGYENKVKANLASRIQSMNMEDKIYDVVVPTEEVMELKSGKMQAVQKKVFPGYILVRMELDDDSWYVVRNTPGVTGFVGSGAKPTPLDFIEVERILQPKIEDRPKPKLEYEVGEVVSVVGGAFSGYSGPVNAIDQDKQRVTVLLDLFGRETPVELTFDQVTKL